MIHSLTFFAPASQPQKFAALLCRNILGLAQCRELAACVCARYSHAPRVHKRIQDRASARANCQELFQQLHRLFSLVIFPSGWHPGNPIASRQRRLPRLPVYRHFTIAPPHNVLAVGPKSSRLIAGRAFVPYYHAFINPSGHLKGISKCWQIAPIYECSGHPAGLCQLAAAE